MPAPAGLPTVTGMQTAVDRAGGAGAGRLDPRRGVGGCLAGIAATDRGTGASHLVDAEGARRAADALTGRADLSILPLAGVPVAVKDNLDVAGLPTRYGSASTVDIPAGADDPMVARLRAAGAVVVGKTRMPELAIWGFTESRAFGGTRNPRDPSRNAGGSTGGGAAAVAAGMVAPRLGSHRGRTLRIPPAPRRGGGPQPRTPPRPLEGCPPFGPIPR